MGLKYILDTNICIYIMREKPMHLVEQFEAMTVGELSMSTITYGELLFGVHKSTQQKKNHQMVNKLLHFVPSLPLTIDAADYYGRIKQELQKKGTPIGNNDLWIAAHALSLDTTLVTNNQKEFKRIQGLKLENWV